MSRRAAYGLAWCLWALAVLITATTLVLQIANAPSAWLEDSINSLILLAFASVGAGFSAPALSSGSWERLERNMLSTLSLRHQARYPPGRCWECSAT
jgi:hypothetical protein